MWINKITIKLVQILEMYLFKHEVTLYKVAQR